MMAFRFHDPAWLWLLIPLLLLGWIMAWRRPAAVLYSSIKLLKLLPQTSAQRFRRRLPWVGLASLALLVIALARPQYADEESRVRVEGIAVEMCIDRSGSMQTCDFKIGDQWASRLEVVKRVFRQFVGGEGGLPGRPDDLVGLVDFGGFAEARCPLTLDHDALLHILATVKVFQSITDSEGHAINDQLLAEEQRTAIGDALALAIDRLRPIKAKNKIIILLSDGESNAGVVEPEEAANVARIFGIKVYTIGIGAAATPTPAKSLLNRRAPAKQPTQPTQQTQPSQPSQPTQPTQPSQQEDVVDERTLTMIAETTGGQYFNAQDTKALQNIYMAIDKLESPLAGGRIYAEYWELCQCTLFPGLGLILLQLVLASTRFRSLP